MIRLEPLKGAASIARVYDDPDPGPMAPYCATFVAEWDTEDARFLWIKSLTGSLTRRTLRELVTLLVDLGVHTVLAKRAEGHVLPLGVTDEHGITRINVARLAERFAQQGASNWIDLDPPKDPA